MECGCWGDGWRVQRGMHNARDYSPCAPAPPRAVGVGVWGWVYTGGYMRLVWLEDAICMRQRTVCSSAASGRSAISRSADWTPASPRSNATCGKHTEGKEM